MERESLSDALAVIKSKGFWKILGAASVIASSIASGVAFVGKPGLVWITSQRDELKQGNKLTADRLDSEMKERLKSEHLVEEFRRKTEFELIAICREHVRFVAASRKQQVGDVLNAYDTFVEYWP